MLCFGRLLVFLVIVMAMSLIQIKSQTTVDNWQDGGESSTIDYPDYNDGMEEVEVEGDSQEEEEDFVRQNRAYTDLNSKQSTTQEYPVFLDDDQSSEPSCEELRAIWRMTKRAARHSILTNEIPRHVPTSLYGYMVHSSLPDLPSSKSGGVGELALPKGQAFGRIVFEPHNKFSPHPKPYRPPHHGSYDRVEEMLRQGIFNDRPYKELGATGKFRTRGSILYSAPYFVTPSRDNTAIMSSKYNGQTTPKGINVYNNAYPTYRTSTGNPSLYSKPSSVIYGVYGDPNKVTEDDELYTSGRMNSPMGFLKSQSNAKMTSTVPVGNDKMSTLRKHLQNDKLRSANTPNDNIGFSSDSSGCKTLQSKKCRTDNDCSCYGLYGCIYGKCKTYTSQSKDYSRPTMMSQSSKGNRGFWHQGIVSGSNLRDQTIFDPNKKFRSQYTNHNPTLDSMKSTSERKGVRK